MRRVLSRDKRPADGVGSVLDGHAMSASHTPAIRFPGEAVSASQHAELAPTQPIYYAGLDYKRSPSFSEGQLSTPRAVPSYLPQRTEQPAENMEQQCAAEAEHEPEPDTELQPAGLFERLPAGLMAREAPATPNPIRGRAPAAALH